MANGERRTKAKFTGWVKSASLSQHYLLLQSFPKHEETEMYMWERIENLINDSKCYKDINHLVLLPFFPVLECWKRGLRINHVQKRECNGYANQHFLPPLIANYKSGHTRSPLFCFQRLEKVTKESKKQIFLILLSSHVFVSSSFDLSHFPSATLPPYKLVGLLTDSRFGDDTKQDQRNSSFGASLRCVRLVLQFRWDRVQQGRQRLPMGRKKDHKNWFRWRGASPCLESTA